MLYTPRSYQQKAVDDIIKHYKSKSKAKAIAVLGTGTGKSLIIAEVIRQLGNPKTLVLQPSVELLTQNFSKYKAQGGEASLYSASVGSKEVGQVTYATVGSIKGVPKLFKDVELVLLDEAHNGTKNSGMIDRLLKHLPKAKVIGLTATPLTLVNKSGNAGYYTQLSFITRVAKRFWTKIIHVTQLEEVYNLGYLSPLRFTTFDFGLRDVKTKGSDFDLEEVSKKGAKEDVIPFAAKLLKEAIKRGKKKILIFTPTLGDAHLLQELVPSIEIVEGKTKKSERKTIIDNFVNGDLRVIVNFGTLITGFDSPELDLIINIRPTKSYVVYYQLCGRGMRIAEGKELCDIVDLSGNYKVFGNPRNMTFEDHKDYGWGMFARDFLMSGVPLGQKIHKDDLDIQNQKITFGTHKGTMFKDVPTQYLEWCAKNFDMKSAWAKENVRKPLIKLGIL